MSSFEITSAEIEAEAAKIRGFHPPTVCSCGRQLAGGMPGFVLRVDSEEGVWVRVNFKCADERCREEPRSLEGMLPVKVRP